MKPVADCRLYGIVDLGYVEPGNVTAMTRALVEGGAEVVQLRAKKTTLVELARLARLMHAVTHAAGVPLIINDHARIAADIGAEGVHVGQEDDAIAVARAIAGGGVIIGKSTHSPLQAAAAQAEGADYIGFGPLFPTGTKPDYTAIGLDDIAAVQRAAQVPVFCIGGVNHARLDAVLAAGAARVVVVSAFLLADEVRRAVAAVRRRLDAVAM